MTKRVVLIIDDDHDVHAMLKKRLEHSGFSCVSLFTVETAMLNLERIHPDLVLLDLGFPDEDGTTFLKHAKDYLSLDTPMPPVIVMSSHDDERIMRQAMSIGARGFIGKPYDPVELLEMIEDSIDEEPNQCIIDEHESSQDTHHR